MAIPFLNDVTIDGTLVISGITTHNNSVNMTKKELQNVQIQNLATAPGSAVEGQIYYDTVLDKLGVYTATGWQYLGVGDMLTSVYDPDVDGTIEKAKTLYKTSGGAGYQEGDYYLARANHTGTQVHTTISDFDAGVQTNRLDQMAVPTASINMNTQKITNLATPVSDTDAANKGYVDSAIAGLDWKVSVKTATTANITLSGTQTIDGTTLIAGDRVLVKDQTTASQNGIYVVAAGAWSRATDMDSWAEFVGSAVFVEQGTSNADSGWVCTVDNGGTLGTTTVSFTQFTSLGQVQAGLGLSKTGNSLDVNVDNQSIEIATDTLQAKLDASGAITKSASGIKVGVDNTTIEISSNVLQIKNLYRTRKYTSIITGTGAIASFTITHNFSTRDVVIQIYDGSAYTQVFPEIEHTTTSAITVKFKTAPANGKTYNVVVLG